jgi:hypothetical protein
MKPKHKRRNFLGFGKKVTHSSGLLKDAYDAGYKSGDTGQFRSWFERNTRGQDVHRSLRKSAEKRYRAGIEALWNEEKKEKKAQKVQEKKERVVAKKKEKEQITDLQREVVDALAGQGMKRSEATSKVKHFYKSGDSFGDLFRKVVARNPAIFDKCVTKVSRSLKKAKRPGNAYAICAAAGTRNPKTQGYHLVDSFKDKATASQIALKYKPFKVVQRGRKWEVWTKQPVKKAKNADPAVDLIPGGSTIDAYAKAGHRVVKGVTRAAKRGYRKALRVVEGKKNPSKSYQDAYEKSGRAIRAFKSVQSDYLSRKIGDSEFLAAKKKYDAAMEDYDRAYEAEQRRSKNPLELARQRHQEFTGFPSGQTLAIMQRQHVHSVLTGLAQFVAFNLIGVDGKELPPLIANGMKYDGPPEEILFSFKGKPKGDWSFDAKTPAKDITWLTASEQTARNGKEMKQQLYLSGGIKALTDADLRYLRIEPRDLHDNTLIGTITRIWYLTKKVFEAGGKEKVWFFHDFGKEGSAGVCPVLIYHPLDPSFEIAGGRYYIALPRKDIGASPGIVG